ncbi:MAG: hypothetical protein QOG20_2495 [Pseudonocardiales bacterium]|nr:hypothetical protein [Pseudonocardiales bacterium]
MGERVGQVRDIRAGLRVDLAALQAVAAVGAVRPVAEGAVDDPDRPHAHLDPAAAGALAELRRGPGDRMRGEGVAVRVPPGPVLPGDRKLAFDLLIVRQQVPVGDRPVRADPVVGEGGEVAGVEAGGVAGVVHHRPADAAAGVVLAQLDRVGPADHAVLGPVQLMAARLVRHPVLVGVPERARLQDHDPPPAARQALSKHGPARTRADDDQIDLVTVGVAAHGLLSRKVAGVHVEQEPGVVRPRPDRALEDAAPEVAHQLVPPSTSTSGSRSVAPGVSKGSREPAAAAPGPPSLMNPRG